MTARMGRPTWAEVDLDALVHNYRQLGALIGPVDDAGSGLSTRHPRLIPVIKANAYGHGAVPAARALARAGAAAFAVAIVEEALVLREAGIKQEILVLEGAWPGQESEAVANRLILTVSAPDSVRRLEDAARASGEPSPVHIKIDTGMTRLGVPWNHLEPLLDALERSPHVRVTGTYSHLAASEEPDQAFTQEQIRRFRLALEHLRAGGLDPGELHLSNSGGLLYCAQLRGMSARPGIALYGYPPAPERAPVLLKPVLSLKTRVARIQAIAVGESVGYSRTFVAQRTTRVATLPIGYADGYRRDLGGKGWVFIRDRRAPLLGRVSMDLITVDVTDLPEVQVGDEVVLLGLAADLSVTAVDWADLSGTIPYEILTGIGPRVPRVYLPTR